MATNEVLICSGCGQLTGIKSYDEHLWGLYHRRRDGKQNVEPLVYTQDDLQEQGFYDDDYMRESVMLSMERDMHSRGLCTECRRPNLAGLQHDDFIPEEDLQEMQDMWAEQAAERRAGC